MAAIQYDCVTNEILLRSDYEQRELSKTVPGGSWDKRLKCWRYPVEAATELISAFSDAKVDRVVADLIRSLSYREAVVQSVKDRKSEPDKHPFLMYHQRQCREIAKYYNRFAFFLDTGTGKTVLSLQIMVDKGATFLVVCPKSIIKSAWCEDAEQFFPDVRLLPLSRNMLKEDYVALWERWGLPKQNLFRATKEEVFEKLKEEAHAYIINPESFKVDVADIRTMGISGLILDESTTIKNPQSQTTKAITDFAKGLDYVYILSGKPAPNNEMDYFSQMRLIDSSLLGGSFFAFKNRYFHPTGYGGYEFKLNDGADKEIADRIAKKSIIIRKEDCLDLPEKTYLKRMVELPKEAYRHYYTMEKAMVTFLQDTSVTASTKAASLMKLRQITSGFIYDEDGKAVPLHNSKLDELKAVLTEIGDKQVIIWVQFKEEVKEIMSMLGGMSGVSAVDAYSGTKTLDENIKAFKQGHVQYMVAHPSTLKFGVTFTNCTYAVYYSMSYNFEEYYQSHDRIYRKGQEQPCTFLFLIAEKTIDEIIYKAVQNKGTAATIIEEFIRRFK